MNSAAVNIHVHYLFEQLSFFRYISKCGFAESYENCMFNVLRNHQTILFMHILYPPSSTHTIPQPH